MQCTAFPNGINLLYCVGIDAQCGEFPPKLLPVGMIDHKRVPARGLWGYRNVARPNLQDSARARRRAEQASNSIHSSGLSSLVPMGLY